MRRRILVVAVCVAAAVAAFALTRHEAPKTHLRLARLSKPEATDVSSARAQSRSRPLVLAWCALCVLFAIVDHAREPEREEAPVASRG